MPQPAESPTAHPDDRLGLFRVNAIRGLLACVAAALLLAVSSGAPTLADAALSAFQSATGVVFGLAVARWLTPPAWFRTKLWAAALMIAAGVTAPVAAIVLGAAVYVKHEPFTLNLVREVLPQVFATSLVMTALALVVRRVPAQTHAAAPDSPPPKFLARLPAKLQGAELFAVEAEDHYLRLHTSLGQDLILMRLADAIAELEGLEGAQTHRSWWVARAAVTAVERGDGRATLTLKDGAQAPVSRGFARSLRDAGWF